MASTVIKPKKSILGRRIGGQQSVSECAKLGRMPFPPEESAKKRLTRAMGRALSDFSMLSDGDRVLVAVSGGKDSYTLLHLMREAARRAPIGFSLVAVNIDQGHPGYPAHVLVEYMNREGYDFRLIKEDTYSIVKEKIPEGKTYCPLCSRLRRGLLYRIAAELGCNKIALGHHRDDVLQTFWLNIQFAGMLAAMPPKLVSEGEGRGPLTVIRPLVYCAEDDIRVFAEAEGFPILPCDLCGSQDNLQRKVVGRMIDDLERARPGTKQIMLAALQNVRPSQLLDRDLWQKMGLPVAQEEKSSDVIPLSRLSR
jgi:tRNA 2-thiocytidine biosynthesis protein TtcA